MKKRNTVFAVLLSAAFLLTACQNSTEPAAEDTAVNTNSDTAGFENIKVRKLDGTETDMNSILSSAELTVFNVWEPSCTSCRSEMEALAALGDQYSGRGVQIIGVIKGVLSPTKFLISSMACCSPISFTAMIIRSVSRPSSGVQIGK